MSLSICSGLGEHNDISMKLTFMKNSRNFLKLYHVDGCSKLNMIKIQQSYIVKKLRVMISFISIYAVAEVVECEK
jgi:hypothetical protein